MSIEIFVEGGGNSKSLRSDCRQAFAKFFGRAGLAGRRPRVRACGPRSEAYKSFRRAVEEGQGTSRQSVLLLVDSEGPVEGDDPWRHLEAREQDQWAKPPGSTAEQCHLMVQTMESWFLADPKALAEHFGAGFDPKALPRSEFVERVPREQVAQSLAKATRGAKGKRYDKGRDSFRILMRLDPGKVRAGSPWARRFLEALGAVSGVE
ncbi:MAG: DUF4276 family protein [Acidobacteriota bacterium]